MTRLDELRETGRMAWTDQHRGWLASPEDIVDALTGEGFEECKREMVWTRSGEALGGLWQGLNLRTGAVACAIWVNGDDPHRALVFVHIGDEPPAGRPQLAAPSARRP